MKKASSGFTLIEVMIVVAIIGILAAIAYPSYKDSILKGRRAEGRAALQELLQQQERYMTQNGRYLSFAKNASDTPFKVFSGGQSGDAKYQLRAEACTDGGDLRDCVKLWAEPALSDAAAGKLWLQSTGVKGCDGTAKDSQPALCWP
ncbi:type IV pilin protein [Xylophilus sp. GW821-FHT01B05]